MEENRIIHGERPKQKTKFSNLKGGVYLPKWVLGVIIVLIVLALSFWLGWHEGSVHQKKTDQTQGIGLLNANPGFERNKALVGTVSKISSNNITVTILGNQQSTAAINSQTIIRNTKEQTIAAKSIPVGSRVVVTAEINSNNSLTAQRILVIN